MGFENLPAEAESYLRILVAIDEHSGEDGVSDRMFSDYDDYLAGDGDARAVERAVRSIRCLTERGMVNATIGDFGGSFGGLTAEGRSYFERKKDARREKLSDRLHDYRVQLFSGVVGFALGLIAGNIDRIAVTASALLGLR